MKLPNADRAFVDRLKLADYCLNSDHLRGRHKARVFDASLGLTAEHADDLIEALVDAAQNQTAEVGKADEFGQRYVIEFEMTGPAGNATIRSSWIIRADEDFPRFVTCYVV